MAMNNGGTGFLPARNAGGSSSATRLTSEYELSDDLSRRQLECLEKKYGGHVAHSAAKRIQRAFRDYQLQKQFRTAMCRTSHNAIKEENHHRGSSLQPYLKYQPTSSLRAQLFAARSGQANVSSPRKNSTPCFEPKLSGRSFNDAILSPRLSQRHGFVSPPTAHSTPNRVGGTSPVIWVQNNRQPLFTSINKNNNQFNESDPPSSPSLTPSDSTSMSPSHCPTDLTPSHPRISCQNSTSSNSLESQNLVQIDSMLPINGIRSRPTSDNQQQNSTTSSSSIETNGHPASTSSNQAFPFNGYKVHNHHLLSINKHDNPEQRRRRMYRVALNVFNKKPDRGVQLLIDWRFVDDHPIAIAKFLLTRRGLGKKMIGEFLGTLRSELHAAVLRSVLAEIEMRSQEIDEALREMIHYFQLPTEAQKIDYIMQAFAHRYHACNEYRLPSDITTDAIYVLSFAIIMLNTDLHSPSIKSTQRMNVTQFLKNTWNAFDTHVFDEETLTGVYERIKKTEIRPGNDHVTQVSKVEQTIIGRDKPRLTEQHRRLICYCRVNEIASPNKRQGLSAHQREIFLFNDMILITKAATNRRKDTAQYVLRHWSILLGLKIEEFDGGELFPFAMRIVFPDHRSSFLLNAKNAADRIRFIIDVKESVFECEENERVRIGFELNRQAEARREASRTPSTSSSIETTDNEQQSKSNKSNSTLASIRQQDPVRQQL